MKTLHSPKVHAGKFVKKFGQKQCLEISDDLGNAVFYSYNTIVGYRNPEHETFVTSEKYSVTTTKHISMWIAGRNVVGEMSESELRTITYHLQLECETGFNSWW